MNPENSKENRIEKIEKKYERKLVKVESRIDKGILLLTIVLIFVISDGFCGFLEGFEVPIFQDVNFTNGGIYIDAGFESIGPFVTNKEIELVDLKVDLGTQETNELNILIYPEGKIWSPYVKNKYVSISEKFKDGWWLCAKDVNRSKKEWSYPNEYISFRKSEEQRLVCEINYSYNGTMVNKKIFSNSTINIFSPISPEASNFREIKSKWVLSLAVAIFTIIPGMQNLRKILLDLFKSHFNGKKIEELKEISKK